MPYCKNDPKKTYKGDEPSPKGFGYCAHSENIGTIKNGKDGNKWIISVTSKGVKRWTKYETKKKTEKLSIKNKSSIKNNSSIKLYSEKESLKEKWWDDSDKCDCKKFVSYKRNPSPKYGFNYKDIHGLEFESGKLYKFISYNNFAKKITNIDQDVWLKYEMDKKIIEEEFCGSKKKLTKNNPIFKKINHSGYKIYFTGQHYNFPLAVYIKNKNNPIYIYKIPGYNSNRYFEGNGYDWKNNYKNIWAYIQLIVKIIPQEIFIGKSENTSLDKYCNGYSILIKIDNNKYIFIGFNIYTFTSENKIIKYISKYCDWNKNISCAIDIDNNYYLLQYDVFINGNNLNFLNSNDFYEELEFYYLENPDKFTKVNNYKFIINY